MSDPFSIAAAALGLAASAVDSILKFKKFVDGLAEAPEAIRNIRANLENIGPPLKSLVDVSTENGTIQGVKAELAKAGVNAAVETCGQSSEKFRKQLEKWTKHSSEHKLHWWDRFKTGAWELDSIHTFERTVESCKQTVTMAVATATLLIQADQKTADMQRDTILSLLQARGEDVAGQLDDIKKLVEERSKCSMELVRIADEAEDSGDDGKELQARKSAEQVNAEIKIIEQQEVNYLAMLKRIDSARSSLSVGKVTTDAYSDALVGMPEYLLKEVDARIGDVTTTNHSHAFVGGFDSTINMKDFFRNAPKPPE